MEAIEEVKMIEFFGDPSKAVKIGSSLDPPFEHDLINFLKEHSDVFAWETSDMQGISPESNIQNGCKCRVSPEEQRKVEDVYRLHGLNRACPKDSFPLPRIDAMIDSTSGCELMSFLDAFQGYNQIRLAPEDQEKTSFVTEQGTYCYTVMPFGLKNAGRLTRGGSKCSSGKRRGPRVSTHILCQQDPPGPEERYPQIEKLALALVTAARKLRPYFQSHPVVVLTNHPLKKVLPDPNVSGRMVKWSIELSEHGIEYQTKPTIKAQPLADFISELIGTEEPEHNFLSQERSEVEDIKEEVLTGVTLPSWKDGLEAYLKTGTLLQDPKEARASKLGQDKVEYVLREIHEGSYGNHSGGRALASKALRQGCFWHTMRKDAMDLVRKLGNGHSRETPSSTRTAGIFDCSSGLFLQMGGGGSIKQNLWKRGYEIHLEEYSMPIRHPKGVCDGQWHAIPRSKISPMVRGFQNQAVLYINGYPQSNGQTEVTNRIILQSLKTGLEEAKGNWWKNYGEYCGHIERHRRSTGESPFSLVYGTEAVVPVEIGEKTLRVQRYEPTSNSSERHVDLDLIQELRNNTNARTTEYKAMMAKVYNSKVRSRGFQVGDLVLRRADATKNLEKLDAKWEGPYQVTEVIGSGTYKLQRMDGKEVPRTWNIANLKKYFV
ncbi:UNVERIFIED_CONTAM: hypothetical protein Slati_1422900 [Sesamum latifolium]|uniref:Reverse transcriptase n=1 Tax=Sesamum latifolium TaxID=2727402 RepID=A0AAW2X924_9LAMI